MHTQVPPCMHRCACGENSDAYMVLWYIHTTTKQQNKLFITQHIIAGPKNVATANKTYVV